VLFGKNENEIVYESNNSIYCNVDLLGGIFFFLTLYEEVVLDNIDEHDRFNFKDSFTYKSNLYTRPVVNEYLDVLIALLAKIGFDKINNNRCYQLVVSHDVDVPFSNNATLFNFTRNILADIFIRKSLSTPLRKILAKLIPIKTLKYRIDPYNNFDYIMNVSDKFGIRSTFNFIATNGKGDIDGNYDIEDNFFRKLFQQIQRRGHLIGLHPSYYTMTNRVLLTNQLDKFEKIVNNNHTNLVKINARQHYLRWKNPITWQLYNDVGITQDSSIGSESFLGFRCGTCYEYPVFNLISKKPLNVTELPLLIMDVCAFKSKDTIKTLNNILEINNACKFYKGQMTLLYHNNYIVTMKEKKKYEHLLSMLLSN
jgi:peptidoglycan/xylan/chitin deacetylase (PgdA/CDA1 family)